MAATSREEVERRLLARAGATPRIPRLPAGAEAPLSFAQERMWLLERMLPQVSAYNVPRLLRAGGRLDESALQQAIDQITARHDVLRTSIALVDGAPMPRVHDDARIELSVHDLRGQAEEVRADELVSQLAWQPFDLDVPAVLRVALLRLSDHDRLLLVSHHLVSDHRSASILLGELGKSYDAALTGNTAELPDLTIRYSDFAAWQRERFRGELLDELIAYWRRRLDGAPERLDLPFDRPRPPAKTYAGGEVRDFLPTDLVAALRALAQARNVTLYTVLLSGFYALLHRYTGAEDIVIGSPISGRHDEETMPLIGYFSNTLALRTDVDDGMPFTQLLERVRETTVAAFAHQELPFERLVEALNPPRDPSYTPVFQILLAHDVAAPAITLGAVMLEQMPLPAWPWSRFDLAVGTNERADGGLDLVAEYSTDLFDPETIRRFIGHYGMLLAAIAAEPDAAIATLPLLTPPERRQLLHDWNQTRMEVEPACLHTLVSVQAGLFPERTAVEGAGRSLRYGELEESANRLAHRLRRLGAGPGTLVGVCIERVPETMVALLAILKAGAAYVPVDPTYPPERQAFMLADAQAPVLITQESLLDLLPDHGGHTVCLDRDWPAIAAEPASAPTVPADPDALAYVIYTSGSTGHPKGVEIRHRSVVNLLAAMRERPGLGEDDVVVNVTTPAFDLSVPDLYLPLVCGAKLVIVPREETQDPARLAAALSASGATFMQATPTTWRMLVDAGWEGKPDLRIVCGGEALPRSLANELLDRGASLWHMYGPTETTVWSSINRLDRGHGSTPLGGPIANTRFYVVDSRLEPVPVGVAGELLIGGAGVARGYRRRAELTAEKFFDDPFGLDGEHVYRTGDKVRFRADGTLEFLGRLDNQVKVHGYRIELGEIEAALDAHPDVRQSLAVVQEDGTGDKRLVAYIVAHDGTDPLGADLRQHLAESVPTYSIPSAIVRLTALPLTANGKVDAKALPAPGADRSALAARYVAPRTPIEEALAAIWSELLQVERVGAEDDFFELGGHSLLAVKMVTRLRDAIGVELYLPTVFKQPTLAALAEEVAAALVADAGDSDLELLLDEIEIET